MLRSSATAVGTTDTPRASRELIQSIQARFEAEDLVRRGVCLLNAGQYDRAEMLFARAARSGHTDQSLSSYLAACLLGQDKASDAAQQFAKVVDERTSETTARIRYALACWSAGEFDEASNALREGIRLNPENAELHFQLGTLLTTQERYDEAELRFTQAINIDRRHAEAHVSLALCHGARENPTEALAHLRRAQALKPWDARLGLLLAEAARAARQQGLAPRTQAQMPDSEGDERGVEELVGVIISEPDFVDAFLALPDGKVDKRVFVLLHRTVETAIEQHPEYAELHFHCGRLHARLGRPEDAISENERAIEIQPKFTRALIELAKLYQQTDRKTDAATRLEQAIDAGAEYADVYYNLGNLYRQQGQVGRARSAYKRALVINERYEAAMQALETLPVA